MNCVTVPECGVQDGPGDDDDDEGEEEDPGEGSGGEGGNTFKADDEGDDPLAGLSSDDDEEGAEVTNIILCQFDKVRHPPPPPPTYTHSHITTKVPHAGSQSACQMQMSAIQVDQWSRSIAWNFRTALGQNRPLWEDV